MSQRIWQAAIQSSLTVVLCAAFGSATIGADDSQPAPAEEVTTLLRQLSAPGFRERQAASRRLAELGPAAFPVLEKAAASRELEVSSRALDILKQHFQSPDDASKAPAQAALQRLENSPAAAVAQRARDLLNPPKRLALSNGNVPFQRGAMVTRTVTTHEANGRREVEIRENDKKVTLRTLPGGRIEFELTETQNGKDVSRSVQAADLNELKRKDGYAGQLYEQYQGLHRGTGNALFGAALLPQGLERGAVPLPAAR